MIRTRWAAIGAAVAVTLGAGGIGLVSATSPSDAVAFVPIEPCRLFDTRPDFQVGTRATPLQPDETFAAQATGDNGECTGIPATATGLGLNVTAVDPSAATVLTIWGDGDRPNASSLNPTPGSPPTPNAVTSGITGAGELKVWNAFGTVHVIVDIVGYYTDHNHDDRYYTEAEVDTALGDKANVGDSYTKAESDGRYDDVEAGGVFEEADALDAGGTDKVVASFTLDTPGFGYSIVNASLTAFGFAADPRIRCDITTGTTLVIATGAFTETGFAADVPTNGWENLSGTRMFRKGLLLFPDSGETTYNLVCDADAANIIDNIHMTGIFVPDPDARIIFTPL